MSCRTASFFDSCFDRSHCNVCLQSVDASWWPLDAEFSPVRGRVAAAGLGWMDPAAVGLPSPEVVQAARTGQGWHCALVKRATMSGAASGEGVG